MEIGIQIKQGQILSPQMVQAMEILQMSNQELLEYIHEAQLENPLLEEQDIAYDSGMFTESEPVPIQKEWDGANSIYDNQDWNEMANRPSFDRSDRPIGGENLAEHLYSQTDLTGDLDRAVRTIINHLDDRGYLEESVAELSLCTAMPTALLEKGLEIVRALEPAGVGATNLQHCLALQLERIGEGGSLADRLVEGYLPQLAQNQLHAIAKQMGERREDVQQAVDTIRGLNPKPGIIFGGWGNTCYTVPDIYIIEGDSGLFVQLRQGDLPMLTISHYYQSLLNDGENEVVQQYLTNKMKQAKWLMQGISQRQETLGRCAQFILERQMDFFQGTGDIKPLLLRDGGECLGIHESTVSRALRNKYLQCNRGVFPLAYFFSRSVGGEDGTVHQIKGRLQRLIQSENKNKPLSDQKLCDLLASEGISLSRRTVTKYREAMDIPAAIGRKRNV